MKITTGLVPGLSHGFYGCLASLACLACSTVSEADPEVDPGVDRGPGSSLVDWHHERGFVTHEGRWVRAVDLPRIELGYPLVDLDYLDADEFDRHEQGLYRAGGHWFGEADANDYHSRLLRWWRLPSEAFVVYSTCRRDTSQLALDWMERAGRDLLRIFGSEPALPTTVILLRSAVQYNAFATIDPEPGIVAPETFGYSAFHYAFPCEEWLDPQNGADYPGAACAYWDEKSAAGNAWGPFAVRCAAALAYVENIDPSPKAIRHWRANPEAPFPRAAYWREKGLPLWLRYGAALYCERFFVDPEAQDPLWALRWSSQELLALDGGGDLDFDEIFAFEVGPTAIERSRLLMLHAGLLVAYLVDGNDSDLEVRHAALKQALRRMLAGSLAEREELRASVRALEAELRERSRELRAFLDRFSNS